MNHATTYRTGNCTTARQKTTRTITPTIREVRGVSTTSQRPERNPKRPKAVRTSTRVANGFLKATFLPKMEVTKEQLKIPKKQVAQTEQGFYQSLSQLEKHYGISVLETGQYSYPYNIALAYWDAEQQLKKHPKSKNFDELQIIREEEKTTVRVIEKCDTGSYLHYIPITPLFRLLKNKQKQQTAQLLLSVFCYLYRVIGVPFYREEDAYLYWLYDMIQEWNSEEEENEDKEILLSELRKAECIGDYIVHKIQSKENLVYWENRLQNFQIKDNFDKGCLTIATRFFDLYQQYENRHIYLNFHRTDEDYDDECVSMDKYLSFIADTKDGLSDQLFEIVNTEFSEYGEMEEPTIYKHFNGTEITDKNLGFENRFFMLVTQLCRLLN